MLWQLLAGVACGPDTTGRSQVYRLCRLTINKSLSAVQTHHQQRSINCTDLPHKSTGRAKVYRLLRFAIQVYRLFKSPPAIHKSTGRAKVYRPSTSLSAAQTCHKSTCCTKVYRLFSSATQVYGRAWAILFRVSPGG